MEATEFKIKSGQVAVWPASGPGTPPAGYEADRVALLPDGGIVLFRGEFAVGQYARCEWLNWRAVE